MIDKLKAWTGPILQFVAKTVGGKRTVAGVHWDYDGYGATLKNVRLMV